MKVLNIVLNTIAVVISLTLIPFNIPLGIFLLVMNGILLVNNIIILEKHMGDK